MLKKNKNKKIIDIWFILSTGNMVDKTLKFSRILNKFHSKVAIRTLSAKYYPTKFMSYVNSWYKEKRIRKQALNMPQIDDLSYLYGLIWGLLP